MKLIVFNGCEKNTLGCNVPDFSYLVDENEYSYFNSFEPFSRKISAPSGLRKELIVLFVAGKKVHLEKLLNIRKMMLNVRLVLVLPEENFDMIRMGHELYPRFLATADHSLDQIIPVLKNIVKRVRLTEEIEKLRYENLIQPETSKEI